MTRKPKPTNLDDFISRYKAGESEKALSRELNVERSTFRIWLHEAGVEPRGRSAAMYARMARTSPAERMALAQAAHDAMRGTKRGYAELVARAGGKSRLCKTTPVEDKLTAALRARGLSVVQQRGIGPFNVDVAIKEPRVAVEVFGGNFHASGRHLARHWKRCEHILDAGWTLVVVWVDGRRYPFGIGCTEYIVTLCNELRALPSERRQYRVILGNGNPAPAFGSYLNCGADVERLGCRHYAWSADQRPW